MGPNIVRKPAVAGRFYPRNAAELRQTVEDYIIQPGVEAAPDRVVTVVAPHAGYIYSGPTAGFVYARVKGKKPKRVILVGCSHRSTIDTASVFTRGVFETTVGDFPIDEAFAGAVADEAGSETDEPHLLEHALEVQLPFLMVAIGATPIVPILFGSPPSSWHAEFGGKLAAMADESDLFVASTDLSHYLTQEEANTLDKVSLDAVLTKDWRAYAKGIATGTCAMCGAPAVACAMAYSLARNAQTWTLLDYRTSAEASGDYDRVVGYAAISMERAA